MSQIWIIASDEWRYWLRSKLALSVIALFVVMLFLTSVLTALRMEAESHGREHHQADAEQTFLSQPDRHPHRMVHYGHYVFRAPAPLALFDPGLDSVTGQSMFLEGHRQNSAMFSDSGSSADLGGLSWLTPAMIYQPLGPLLIVLLGHGAIVREREARTLAPLLAQGTGGLVLVLGKSLALLSFVMLMLVPLLASALVAVSKGESLLAAISLAGVYFLYLAVWGALTLFVSSLSHGRSAVLAMLITLWVVQCLVLPSIAVNVASRTVPLIGKIETDLALLEEKRSLGDGHNANDPAFDQLRADLLEQEGVERVEDLAVNLRGMVAQMAEEKLTELLNTYADARMDGEVQQKDLMASHGWLTPTLAVADASRALSGTDLVNYHAFLRQAEDLRYEFVQGLNRAHAQELSYVDDINRSRDEEFSRRARVDSANWQVLEEFRFQPAAASARLTNASAPITMLLVWMGLLCAGLVWMAGRLKP